MQNADANEVWELGLVLVNTVYEGHSTKSKIVTRHKGLLLSTARYRSSCSQLTSSYFTSGPLYWFCFACLEHRDLCTVTKHWPISKSRFTVDKYYNQCYEPWVPSVSRKTLYTMRVLFVLCSNEDYESLRLFCLGPKLRVHVTLSSRGRVVK